MGSMEGIMSGVMTICFYAIVLAVVWKVNQVAADLSEIKTLLVEQCRTSAPPAAKPLQATVPVPPPPPGPISLESAEALLRQVEAESHVRAAGERPKTTA